MQRATISGVMLLIVLALVAPVHTTFVHLSLDNSLELNSSPDAVSQAYIPHDAISIDRNEDFFSQAALEGWNGSGTENDPIIIERYSITGSLHLFRAINTDVHFVFRNNFLDGVDQSWCGFYMSNASNGRIYGNTVTNSATPIHVITIQNCLFENNIMYHNGGMVVALEWTCTENVIRNNIMYDNFGGIWLDWNNTGNVVANNSIFDNHGDGIVLLEDANNNLIVNNTIVDNTMSGILCRGYNNEISNNLILRNTHNGVLLADGGNTIQRNVIQNNSRNGVMMYTFSQQNDFNVISNNSILQNRLYAVTIGTGCAYNTISRNNIINNGEKYQSYDKGENNTFAQNYWNPWNSTDVDDDSFVDYPYIIEGNANNTDRFPLIEICAELPVGYEFDPNTPAIGIVAPTSVDSDPFSMYFGFMIPSLTFITIVLLVVLVFRKNRLV